MATESARRLPEQDALQEATAWLYVGSLGKYLLLITAFDFTGSYTYSGEPDSNFRRTSRIPNPTALVELRKGGGGIRFLVARPGAAFRKDRTARHLRHLLCFFVVSFFAGVGARFLFLRRALQNRGLRSRRSRVHWYAFSICTGMRFLVEFLVVIKSPVSMY